MKITQRGITFGYQWQAEINKEKLRMKFKLINYKGLEFEIDITRFEYEDSLKKYLQNNLPLFKGVK